MDLEDWKIKNDGNHKRNDSDDLHNVNYSDRPVFDVVHLQYPVSMESVIRCLDLRFIRGHLETWLGPSLIIVNPYSNTYKLPLETNQDENHSKFLKHKIIEVLQELFHTKYPQTIVFNGENGSGKTYNASQALYYLFSQTNRGLDVNSCFSKVSAALVVLQSLITVSTLGNQSSSRVGLYIQNYIREYAIFKTKINCVYIDHARLTNVKNLINNYHIFYQMLAGLTDKEKSHLYLDGFTSTKDFYYLSMGNPPAPPEVLQEQFEKWRACLITCDVSFDDVTRILAAVLLLGNITFVGRSGLELDVKGQNELKAVAALLGVSSITLYQGLTTRTCITPEGINAIPISSANSVHASRDALARALYIRTIHTIVRKVNSVLKTQGPKKKGRKLSTGSCKSEDRLSSHPSFNSCSSDRSTCATNASYGKQPASLINILDMFGFENFKTNGLEQLAINLCSETLQSYYNSHILRPNVATRCHSGEGSGSTDLDYHDDNDPRDEIEKNQYFDNRPIIDLISHPVFGIFTFLHETVQDNANPTKSLLHRIQASHHRNSFLTVNLDSPCTVFTIHHSADSVVYDATTFTERNKDTIPDDIVWVFSQENCVFGFASHLFYQEIDDGCYPGPQGKLYKVLPRVGYGRMSSHTNSLTENFCLKLEEILKKIALTKPHFVHCIKTSDSQSYLTFKMDTVCRQLSAMQVVETVNLMKTTPIHRMKYSAFTCRYQLLLPKRSKDAAVNPVNTSADILNHLKDISRNFSEDDNSFNWIFRQKHLLFSELVRQELEAYKLHIFYQSATLIQSQWRGFQCRKRWPFLLQHLRALQLRQMESLSADNTVFVTTSVSKLDWKTVHQICAMYGIDPKQTPAVPPLRHYSVVGNMKVKFPQTRIVTQSYKVGKKAWLQEGDEVKVIGPSTSKAGHLIVQWQNQTHDVPHQALLLKTMGTLL